MRNGARQCCRRNKLLAPRAELPDGLLRNNSSQCIPEEQAIAGNPKEPGQSHCSVARMNAAEDQLSDISHL